MTMPQTVPSESTTGRPGSSCSRSAATTSSTDVSGRDRHRVRVHDLADQLCHGRDLTEGAQRRWPGAPRSRRPPSRGRRRARSAACAGRQHVRERAERGRLERAQPLRQQRADQAGEHVAGAGGGERGRAARADRERAARAARRSCRRPSAAPRRRSARPPRARAPRDARPPRPARRSSSRPSSASCGVSTVGRVALAEQLELPGVGVQAVGVHEQRRLHRARPRRGRTPARPRRGRGPGPSTTAPARSAISSTSATPCGRVEAVVVRQPAAHLLEQAQVHRLLHRLRHRHLHVARPGALRPSARPSWARRSAPPSRPTTTTTPESNFEPLARPARVEVEHALGDQPGRGRRRARRAGCRSRPPRLARRAPCPGSREGRPSSRGRWRWHGARTASALHLAGRGVHARGHVAGHHGRVLRG